MDQVSHCNNAPANPRKSLRRSLQLSLWDPSSKHWGGIKKKLILKTWILGSCLKLFEEALMIFITTSYSKPHRHASQSISQSLQSHIEGKLSSTPAYACIASPALQQHTPVYHIPITPAHTCTASPVLHQHTYACTPSPALHKQTTVLQAQWYTTWLLTQSINEVLVAGLSEQWLRQFSQVKL